MQAYEPIKILLVDDKPENLLALEATLAPLGLELIKASSGREALARVLEHQFAAILLDVNMPEMSGLETAALIRRREKSQTTPIIFISAVFTDLEHIQLGYRTGAVDYILKPFDPNIVRSKVSSFAQLFRLNRELAQKNEALYQERSARRVSELTAGYYVDFLDRLDHSIVWEMTRDNQFRFVSQRAVGLLGFPLSDWLTKKDFLVDRVFEDDRALVREAFETSFATGLDQRCEHRIVAANGKLLWFHTGVQIEKASDATGLKMRGLSVEITPFKEEEERARRYAAGAGRLVAANVFGHLLARIDGTICETNDRFLGIFGYSRADMMSSDLRWPRLTVPEDRPRDELALQQLRDDGMCSPYQKDCLHKDGHKVSVLFGAAMLEGSSEEFSGFLLPVGEDATR